MAQYILAHDLGTSGNKATLFSVNGKLIGSRTVAYSIFQKYPLWAEQDAKDWWNAVCVSTKQLLHENQVSGEDVVAISFSGQMMGCLPVDKNGVPLRNAIIWADQRAQKQASQIGEKIAMKKFYNIVGHRNTASYGIQKAMWIKENEPEIYKNTYKFLNAKDYIVNCLTGKFYTDYSDANSMGCLDLAKREWSQEIVAASQIDPQKLPEIVNSTFYVGNVSHSAAIATGLGVSTKVIMGAGDGVAANVGAGSVQQGSAYCCMGTSAWVAATSEKIVLDDDMRIVCWAHAVPDLYSPNGTMQYAGGTYNWLKNTLCEKETLLANNLGVSPYDYINKEIEKSEVGANGVLFLPHLLGERAPRWNPQATGSFYGITSNTSREDMLRSIMEGIVMNLSICVHILKNKIEIKDMLLIGGSAKSSLWQQTISDMYGVNVLVPQYLEEASSMGAAVIAGVGSGIYKDFSAINKFILITATVKPKTENFELYKKQLEQFNCLYNALENAFWNKDI